MLGRITGTALFGVVLPAVLQGALDPNPIWLGYAVLTAGSAVVFGWRWPALESANGIPPCLVVTSCLLLGVLVPNVPMAGPLALVHPPWR